MPVSRDPMLLAGLTVTFLHLELAILRRSQFYRRLAYVAHDPRHAICASVSIEASPPVTAILAPAATVYICSGTPLIARGSRRVREESSLPPKTLFVLRNFQSRIRRRTDPHKAEKTRTEIGHRQRFIRGHAENDHQHDAPKEKLHPV